MLNPPESSCVIQRATKPAPNIYRDVTRGGNESLNVYSEFPISASRGETAVTLRPVLQRFRATMFQMVAATNSIAPPSDHLHGRKAMHDDHAECKGNGADDADDQRCPCVVYAMALPVAPNRHRE